MAHRNVIISLLVILYMCGYNFANVSDEVRITKVTEVQGRAKLKTLNTHH